ncbi:hypothetical protein [Paenibacillus physcomitrellae]|uniref:DUF304 domain-containing protein n=1 Tax=Paenibacillus physcomitrellae TaxID=1619311 RepID=A0ABQ1GMF6_9BACL|nr:hypothetical protein [Paenibacillus physcomitrellae]GGA46684.1 hypothetical protein GCM10010917_34990 [Paenibacillus physcomitrellae]
MNTQSLKQPRTYVITHFWGVKPVFSSLILMVILGFSMYQQIQAHLRHPGRQSYFIFIGLFAVCFTAALIQLVVSILRYFKRGQLTIGDEYLVVDGLKLYPEQIHCIMVDEYFLPSIAVKPRGKRITPGRLVFRFTEAHVQSLVELDDWAKNQGIRIINKRFFRWM